MRGIPLIVLFAAMGLGIGTAEVVCCPLCVWWAMGAVSAMGLALAWRFEQFIVVNAIALTFCLGALQVRHQQAPAHPPQTMEEAAYRLRIDAPVGREQTADGTIMHTTAKILWRRHGLAWLPCQGRVMLRLRPGTPVVRGDEVEIKLSLRPLPRRRNLFDVDSQARGRRQGLSGAATVRSEHALVRPGGGFWAWLDHHRHLLAQDLEQSLPRTEAAVAKALALGDTASIDGAQRDAWADAGMAHLLSVSGLHVSIVAAALMFCIRAVLSSVPMLWPSISRRRLAASLVMPALGLYCLLCGAPPSACRATLMAAALLCGIWRGVPGAAANAWGLAGLVMLGAQPLALYDISFLLSFCAVAALLWLVPAEVPQPALMARLWARLCLSMRASFAASFLTLPLCAHAFGKVAVLAPVVNLAAVPLGSILATPLALTTALSRYLPGPVRPLVTRALQLALATLHHLAHAVATVRFAAVSVPKFGICQWIAFVGLLVALYARPWRLRTAAAVSSALAILPPLWCAYGGRVGPLTVRHLYVGQGDATLVTFPRGKTMLIDGGGAVYPGGFDPGRAIVLPLLRKLGLQRLDIVVLTHPHPDHVGGLVEVTRQLSVKTFWHSGLGEDYAPLAQSLANVRARGGQICLTAALPRTQVIDGVEVDLIHPRASPLRAYDTRLGANDNSVVLRLRYGVRTVVLAGDVEARAERLVAAQLQQRQPIDLLKVPHHGSATSSSWPLLHALMPRVAVVSCGEDNRFGFPHAAPLQRYQTIEARLLRTDVDGMVTWQTDGCRTTLRTVRPAHEVSRSWSGRFAAFRP